MKQLDKMILLTKMQAKNADYPLNILSDLTKHKQYFQEQEKLFKDKTFHTEIVQALSEMISLRNKYSKTYTKLNKHIDNLLRDEEVKILRRDYDSHDNTNPDLDLMTSRIESLDPEFIRLMKLQIGDFSDWRHAGVELNPSNGLLTRSFLACDPLYLYTGNVVDKQKVKEQFNSFFSDRRLMMYNDLLDLPQGQLGLAVSINSYDFWPMDPIKTEIQKVFNLLKPGGHFIFTYNDCEQISSLDLCANDYRAYNTKTLMTSMVQMFGFDIVKQENYCNGAHSFMVVKRPGKLTSQKLGAPLVKVKHKK